MPDRDPLTNPAPGDVVRAKDGRERRVCGGASGRQVTFMQGGVWNIVFVRSWRSWCRKNQAEVVEVGK